jgi:ubiquinone/menaquinone biosynthesis C-methylase UbiE
MMMDATAWNERYAGADLIWTAEPNMFVVDEVAELPPARALDLACGEGRNAVWLASKGWETTGVDFSAVGLAKGRHLADAVGVEVTWIEADATSWQPPASGFDLVILCYLQLDGPGRTAALEVAARATALGGHVLVVAHDRDNLARGVGGPPDASVLYDVEETTSVLVSAGLEVVKAAQVERPVTSAEGVRMAIDTLVRAARRS